MVVTASIAATCSTVGESFNLRVRPHDSCRNHVRLYLQAPFLADEARQIHGGQYVGCHTADVITSELPPSLQQALQEWAVDASTPDGDVAGCIGWTVERVREHR